MTKLWAVRDELNLAISMSINNLEIEFDAEVVVQMIKFGIGPNSPLNLIVSDCKLLISKFHCVELNYVLTIS
jgi:hypothetical protein